MFLAQTGPESFPNYTTTVSPIAEKNLFESKIVQDSKWGATSEEGRTKISSSSVSRGRKNLTLLVRASGTILAKILNNSLALLNRCFLFTSGALTLTLNATSNIVRNTILPLRHSETNQSVWLTEFDPQLAAFHCRRHHRCCSSTSKQVACDSYIPTGAILAALANRKYSRPTPGGESFNFCSPEQLNYESLIGVNNSFTNCCCAMDLCQNGDEKQCKRMIAQQSAPPGSNVNHKIHRSSWHWTSGNSNLAPMVAPERRSFCAGSINYPPRAKQQTQAYHQQLDHHYHHHHHHRQQQEQQSRQQSIGPPLEEPSVLDFAYSQQREPYQRQQQRDCAVVANGLRRQRQSEFGMSEMLGAFRAKPRAAFPDALKQQQQQQQHWRSPANLSSNNNIPSFNSNHEENFVNQHFASSNTIEQNLRRHKQQQQQFMSTAHSGLQTGGLANNGNLHSNNHSNSAQPPATSSSLVASLIDAYNRQNKQHNGTNSSSMYSSVLGTEPSNGQFEMDNSDNEDNYFRSNVIIGKERDELVDESDLPSGESGSQSPTSPGSFILVSKNVLTELSDQIALNMKKIEDLEEQVKVIPELQRRLDNVISDTGTMKTSATATTTTSGNGSSIRDSYSAYGRNKRDSIISTTSSISSANALAATNASGSESLGRRQSSSGYQNCGSFNRASTMNHPSLRGSLNCGSSNNISRYNNGHQQQHFSNGPTAINTNNNTSEENIFRKSNQRQQVQHLNNNPQPFRRTCCNHSFRSTATGGATTTVRTRSNGAGPSDNNGQHISTTGADRQHLLNKQNSGIGGNSSCNNNINISTNNSNQLQDQLKFLQRQQRWEQHEEHHRAENLPIGRKFSFSVGDKQPQEAPGSDEDDQLHASMSIQSIVKSPLSFSCIEVIKKEWFSVSSKSDSQVVRVKLYLDYFESFTKQLSSIIVNLADDAGNTSMHYAASYYRLDLIKLLLETKVCDVNLKNRAGYTAIMLLALADIKRPEEQEIARCLFQAGDVNIRSRASGQTALMLAASNGRATTCQLLLDCGADPSLQDFDGSTALMCGSELGNEGVVKCLLAHRLTDPLVADNDGLDALTIALNNGHKKIALILYAAKSVPRRRTATLLTNNATATDARHCSASSTASYDLALRGRAEVSNFLPVRFNSLRRTRVSGRPIG